MAASADTRWKAIDCNSKVDTIRILATVML